MDARKATLRIAALAGACLASVTIGSAAAQTNDSPGPSAPKATPSATIESDKDTKAWTEAIKRDPKKARAHANRGRALINSGQFDGAIKELTEAVRLDPTDAETYASRGSAWFSKGDLDKAIRDYSTAIWQDPKHVASYISRASAWAGKGEFEKAVNDYIEAIRLDPKSATAYNDYAWLRATCPDAHYRDGLGAIADATTACELTAWKHGYFIDTLAAACAEAGQFSNAIRWQELAVAFVPKDAQLRKHLELYRTGVPCRDSQ